MLLYLFREKETLRNAVEAFKEERMLYIEQYDNQQKVIFY